MISADRQSRPDPLLSGEQAARNARIFGQTLGTVLAALPVLVVITAVWRTLPETLALAGLLVVVAGIYLLFRSGRVALALHALVAALIGYGIAAIVAYGSIRSTGALGFAAAIVVGGIFLRGPSLVATLVACVAALGALTYLEAIGTWVRPDFQAGPMQWISHSVVLGAFALVMYYARSILVSAMNVSRSAEQRLQAMFRDSPAALFVISMKTSRIVDVNVAYERLFGWSRTDTIGRTTEELGLYARAVDRERHLRALSTEGRVDADPVNGRKRSGEVFAALVSAETVDLADGPHSIGTVIDLSEQRQHEALLVEVARGVSHKMGAEFFHGVVEDLARTLRTDTALVGEILSGERVRALAVQQDGARAAEFEYPLANSPCASALIEGDLRIIPDGVAELYPGFAWLRENGMRGYLAAVLRDVDGTPVGVLNACSRAPLERVERLAPLFRIFAARAQAELLRLRRERVITALNETLEERVRSRTRELEAAKRELEAFAFGVSHDLKAPINRIEGFARLLRDGLEGPVSDAQQRMLERVLANNAAMHALTDALLVLVRAGQHPLAITRLDLSALAADAVAALRAQDDMRAVEVDIELGLSVRADRALVRIVLDHLVGNAWKFTAGRNDARIAIGRETGADGGQAFYVRDNGTGFDMAQAQRLFQPLQRLHREDEFPGHGVGLAMVQRIVSRHGGRVWAQAARDEGATFYFTLDSRLAGEA